MTMHVIISSAVQQVHSSVSFCRCAVIGRIALRRPFLGSLPSCSRKELPNAQQQLQRAGFSTLGRGLTGPMSARKRLPMRGLEEFRDQDIVKAGDVPIVGRPWTAPELRKKSFEDLHKLWFVLYKEKNLLMTELVLNRRTRAPLPAGDRRQKVKRSMKAVRVVVGERQRLKRGIRHEKQLAAKREERQMAALALENEAEMAGSERDTSAEVAAEVAALGDSKATSSSSTP